MDFSFILATVAALAVYGASYMLVMRYTAPVKSNSRFVRSTMKQMHASSSQESDAEDVLSRPIIKAETALGGMLSRMFFALPGGNFFKQKITKAGLLPKSDKILVGMLLVFMASIYFLRTMDILLAIGISLLVSFLATNMFLDKKIMKRRKAIMEMLPDVLEMIVRSVRAGYPLNSVVKIVSENLMPPMSEEFKQVADEMAYGSSMIEAMQRMAKRVEEPDIGFFVVVLTVQQEVGGNLAEVLTNLAKLIRRRKNLRLKILALSAEGRATMWVLGSLPVFLAAAISYVSPEHLNPFFDSTSGNMLFAFAFFLIALAMFIVKKMVNIKV